jgi:hypothetical protein
VDVVEIIALIGAAVVGTLVTAWGTWWVAVRLDRQREQRDLMTAIGILAAELEDNRRRIADRDNRVPLKERVTIGDWDSQKGPFAGLWLRDEGLWQAVVTTYGRIFDFMSGWRERPPTSDQLEDLITELQQEQVRLKAEISSFARLLGQRSSE